MAQVSPMNRPSTLYIDNWQDWWSLVTTQGALLELAALVLCALLAGLVTGLLRRARRRALATQAAQQAASPVAAPAQAGPEGSTVPPEAAPAEDLTPEGVRRPSVLLGESGLRGILFPMLWLLLAYLARVVILQWQPAPILRVALPILMGLVAIRTGVTVRRAAFPGLAVVRVLERTISWVAWVAMALWVTGVLPSALDYLDTITWKMGGTQMSVRTLIEGGLTAGALLLLALWLSSILEARLLRSASGTSLSVRKVIANITRAVMVFVGLMLGLSSVGIDLTALSVLGGAIGVGIGLGLQKLAANYVSGFMVLAERSVRIGDVVRVGGFEGRISDIRARYTVIRALGGAEAIVPNETLMTSTVENLTFSDRRLVQSTTVSVGYDSDVDLVLGLLKDAALVSDRVLRDPSPNAFLTGFGADGLDFQVSYSIGDPENGTLGPRAEINRAILLALRQHKIDIPYPQRVVHQVPAPGAAPTPPIERGAEGGIPSV